MSDVLKIKKNENWHNYYIELFQQITYFLGGSGDRTFLGDRGRFISNGVRLRRRSFDRCLFPSRRSFDGPRFLSRDRLRLLSNRSRSRSRGDRLRSFDRRRSRSFLSRSFECLRSLSFVDNSPLCDVDSPSRGLE